MSPSDLLGVTEGLDTPQPPRQVGRTTLLGLTAIVRVRSARSRSPSRRSPRPAKGPVGEGRRHGHDRDGRDDWEPPGSKPPITTSSPGPVAFGNESGYVPRGHHEEGRTSMLRPKRFGVLAALAVGCALALAAAMATKGSAALTVGPRAATTTATTGCQLNSSKGNIK